MPLAIRAAQATVTLAALLAPSIDKPLSPSLEIAVTVVTRSNHAMTGLARQDFSVEIDDRPTAVEAVTFKRESLAVVLVIDESASTGVVRQPEAVRPAVLNGLFQALNPGDEPGRLGMFGRRPMSISEPMPYSRKAYRRLLGSLEALNDADLRRFRRGERNFLEPRGSPLWDAADRAIKAIAGERGRRLVIVLTDGRVTESALDAEALAERAVKARTAVSFVHEGIAELVKQDEIAQAAVRSDLALRWVAEATGGIYLADATARGQQRAFNTPAAWIMRAIKNHRQVFVLRVTAPASDRPRTLNVTVRDPTLRVLAPAFVPANRP